MYRPVEFSKKSVVHSHPSTSLSRYLVKWERWDMQAEHDRASAFRRASEEANSLLLGLPDVKMQLKGKWIYFFQVVFQSSSH
jgi:hypothetical protein